MSASCLILTRDGSRYEAALAVDARAMLRLAVQRRTARASPLAYRSRMGTRTQYATDSMLSRARWDREDVSSRIYRGQHER